MLMFPCLEMMAFVGSFVFKVDHVYYYFFFNHLVLDPFNQVSQFGLDSFFDPLLEEIIGMVTFLFVKLTILV